MRRLPKQIVVRWNEDGGKEEAFLEADFDLEKFADLEESRIVGIYKLVETVRVKTHVTTHRIKP